MKQLFIAILTLCACAHASAQTRMDYSLPKSVIVFEVKAIRTDFQAGPYAKYASKYFGFEAGENDSSSYRIASVNLKSVAEADQESRYGISLSQAERRDYLALSTQGLIARENAAQLSARAWHFNAGRNADCTVEMLPSNLTEEQGTLYGRGRASVIQSQIVEKSEEQKAREVAEKIFSIREQKYKILVGDTDATYSGEAMKATIDELNRMEAEYLKLFTGGSVSSETGAVFEIIPQKGTSLYVAFRISDEEGLVQADNVAGRPYLLELIPEEISEPKPAEAQNAAAKKKGKAQSEPRVLHYRIPAICTAKLSDGESTLLQTRIPVYQFGRDCSLELHEQTTKK